LLGSIASDTIFMKFFSRSSRATAPKMRVPFGLPSLSTSTQAFESKRTYEPSSRRVGNLQRTMTAWTLSPAFTSPFGSAFLTVQTTRSPTPMVRREKRPVAVEDPRTPMTMASFAPLLSATSSRDSFWIIAWLHRRTMPASIHS